MWCLRRFHVAPRPRGKNRPFGDGGRLHTAQDTCNTRALRFRGYLLMRYSAITPAHTTRAGRADSSAQARTSKCWFACTGQHCRCAVNRGGRLPWPWARPCRRRAPVGAPGARREHAGAKRGAAWGVIPSRGIMGASGSRRPRCALEPRSRGDRTSGVVEAVERGRGRSTYDEVAG